MDLQRATEVFVSGVSRTKSGHYPFTATLAEGIWVMKDDPPRKRPRTSEVVAINDDPDRVVQAIERLGVGWHFLSHLLDPEAKDGPIREAYKRLGYRGQTTEWMFVHDLESIPHYESSPAVRLVETQEALDLIPQQAAHKRNLRPGTRLLGIFDETRDYGWVRSVPVGEDAWVVGLHVSADSRGKGYGRALMSAMLRSDKENGVRTSVLLASSSGARLYPHLGYRQIGVLRMFCPRDRSRFSQ